MDTLKNEIKLYIKSRYPMIYLVTSEENRAERLVQNAAAATQKPCFFWSATEGFAATDKFGDEKTPISALDAVLSYADPGLFILKDFHAFMEDPVVIRKLRDIVVNLKKSYKTLFIISPVLVLPPGLEKDITPVDIPLPEPDELKKIFLSLITPLQKSGKISARINSDLVEKVINASRGLTESEVEHLYARLVVRNKSFDERDLPLVVAEKKKLIRKSGLLDYYDFSENMDTVGGLNNLKTWLHQRGLAFSQKARDFGLPEPKGLLLLGVQGCGKSLAAKATASLWNLPLLKLDVGKIFDSLWLDEIDKAFSGIGGGHNGDSGVSARVFGTFLTWMQEKTAPVFVLATANNIEHLPPELLRKGRFDDIFFIDLPKLEERAQIINIHLQKRNRDPKQFQVADFSKLTKGFAGSEIEQLVISGLYRAFAQDREIGNKDILNEIKETVPLSITYKEHIDELRAWAENRARPAT
jgi:hypothetical protein